MNKQHFGAFLWLRWRLRVNQFRKGGVANLVFFFIIAFGAVFAAVGLFVTGLLVGWLALPKAPPAVRMYVWDGIILAFLFSWMIGLLTELQRTESLSLEKFLHLPVSVSGVFLINYISSLFTLTLLVFVPAAVGLTIGQTIAHGPAMLLAFPLIAAFVLAVTALTYQFQGWLATLMANPRRRRTVIVLITGGFILVAQLPNLINVVKPWEDDGPKSWEVQQERQKEISRAFLAKEIDNVEYTRRSKELLDRTNQENSERGQQKLAKLERTTRLFNLVLPPGWLALGASPLPDGEVLPALLATLAFSLIGAASLWRAYRTTLRLYTGQYGSGERKASTPTPVMTPSSKPRLLERRLPYVSEHASAVALAGFRSLTRAPEAKMALLAPLIMVVVFGGIFFSAKVNLPQGLRPLMAICGAGVVLLSAIQLIGNQFGYDRAGFRAFVLSPVPRREILLGKNLAVAPLAIGLGTMIVLLVGILFPMRIDHYPAAVLQLIATFLLFCLMANVLSILAPMAIASGSMKASNVKLVPVVLQFVFLMVLPIIFMPALVPIGVEALLENLDIASGWPISLALSLLLLALVVLIYRKLISVQGEWLAVREQKVLEIVTSKSE